MQKVQYQIKKTDIIALSTLSSLDMWSIVGNIDILKEYLKRVWIEKVVIINKLLIFKRDFLTVWNIIRIIY